MVAPVVTTKLEVEKPAFVIKQNVGDYCGKSDDKDIFVMVI